MGYIYLSLRSEFAKLGKGERNEEILNCDEL